MYLWPHAYSEHQCNQPSLHHASELPLLNAKTPAASRYGRHRMSRTREYAEWRALRKQCDAPTAKRKGLTLDATWENSFVAFLTDVGPCPDPNARLSRLDPRKGWEAGNTKWLVGTKTRRRSNARL